MPQGGHLAFPGRQAGDAVEVAVRDTGVGISPDQLGHVLEPLNSTKARGLGLAIARAILDKSNGSLRVESELGQGSIFTVRLPALGNDER